MVFCSSFFCASFEGGGRDVRPAAHPPSFASPKEGGPRKGDPQSVSPVRPVGRPGATCDARIWGGAAELAAFFELRSDSCGKSDHEACVSFGTHDHPSSCASRRSQQGWGAGSERLLLRSYAGCRFARRAADGAVQPPWRAERSEGPQAERSNGPSGARSHPLLTVPRSAGAGVSACRRTRASLSGLPQLFERSSKNAASSAAHPRTEHRRLPHSPPGEWGHGQRGRLSFGYFSLAKQRTSASAAGPKPGLRPLHKSRSNHRHPT
jgi:hypothetical protein